jgi:hypothetical protein
MPAMLLTARRLLLSCFFAVQTTKVRFGPRKFRDSSSHQPYCPPVFTVGPINVLFLSSYQQLMDQRRGDAFIRFQTRDLMPKKDAAAKVNDTTKSGYLYCGEKKSFGMSATLAELRRFCRKMHDKDSLHTLFHSHALPQTVDFVFTCMSLYMRACHGTCRSQC